MYNSLAVRDVSMRATGDRDEDLDEVYKRQTGDRDEDLDEVYWLQRWIAEIYLHSEAYSKSFVKDLVLLLNRPR